MLKQSAFPGLRDEMKKKVTKREEYLAQMEAIVPQGRRIALSAQDYPKSRAEGLLS